MKKTFDAKTILQHHGLDVLQFDTGIKFPFFKALQNRLITNQFKASNQYIDTHIAVSSRVKEKLLKIDPLLHNKSIVCFNGVDRTKFFQKNMKESSSFLKLVAWLIFGN